jgi:hypothetical protein
MVRHELGASWPGAIPKWPGDIPIKYPKIEKHLLPPEKLSADGVDGG